MESAAKNAAEDMTYRDRARGIEVNNRQDFINYLEGWAKAFSDTRIADPAYIDGGDKVAAMFTALYK